jgi:hypothetical protein
MFIPPRYPSHSRVASPGLGREYYADRCGLLAQAENHLSIFKQLQLYLRSDWANDCLTAASRPNRFVSSAMHPLDVEL